METDVRSSVANLPALILLARLLRTLESAGIVGLGESMRQGAKDLALSVGEWRVAAGDLTQAEIASVERQLLEFVRFMEGTEEG